MYELESSGLKITNGRLVEHKTKLNLIGPKGTKEVLGLGIYWFLILHVLVLPLTSYRVP